MISAWVLGPWGLVIVLTSLLAVFLWTACLVRRLGGFTGDVLGSAIELGELAIVLEGAAWYALARSDMTTTVYLVRHGSVVGAETRRFIGHLDVPLSPLGERQMAAVARRMASVTLDAVYASDLARTRRSAEILAEPHRLDIVTVPELREFAMGRWEGLTAEEIRGLDAAAFATWMSDVAGYQFPEGESLSQLTGAGLAGLRADRRGPSRWRDRHRGAWRHESHDPVPGARPERHERCWRSGRTMDACPCYRARTADGH